MKILDKKIEVEDEYYICSNCNRLRSHWFSGRLPSHFLEDEICKRNCRVDTFKRRTRGRSNVRGKAEQAESIVQTAKRDRQSLKKELLLKPRKEARKYREEVAEEFKLSAKNFVKPNCV